MAFLNLVQNITNRNPIPQDGIESFKDFDFLKEAEAKLQSSRSVPISTEKTIFRASGIHKMCPREEVLRNIYQVPKIQKIPAKLQITFDLGNAFNDVVQNRWFGPWGWLVGDWICGACKKKYFNQVRPTFCLCGASGAELQYSELEILDRDGLSGHTDGIIEKDGVRKLVEAKTCNSYIYDLVTKKTCRPLPAHTDQTQVYLWMFNVSAGSVIYINKDTSEWVQFPRSPDMARVNFLKDKVKQVREGIRTKVPPPREICDKITCARAKACVVRKKCFEQI